MRAADPAPPPPRAPRVELLAPAGGLAQLQAALDAGADAVYLGLRGLNMRAAAAANFDEAGLREASARCRARGRRLYLTLNAIVFDGELRAVGRTLDLAAPLVDAVLASDWGVVAACRARGVPWHASTQMSCANAEAARFLASQGARRIVLARECSMPEVAGIAKEMRALGVEIEVFVHGAQCVAESGRCFLSHQAYGASASRGECQQPCRRPYVLAREVPAEGSDRAAAEFSVGAHTIFSARDLCSLPFLDRIVAAGAASLKIEGRGRPAEYVRVVVSAYREALDAVLAGRFTPELAAPLVERCAAVYHRRFGEGLFHGRPGARQFTDNDENLARLVKRHVGVVERDWPRAGMAQIRVQDRAFRVGDTLCVQGPRTGDATFEVSSIRHDDEAWDEARKGDWCTVPRPSPVRPGDRVYAVVPRPAAIRSGISGESC